MSDIRCSSQLTDAAGKLQKAAGKGPGEAGSHGKRGEYWGGTDMKFLKQLSIIMGISFLAEIMEYLIPLPMAASIYGLVLMLAGLVTGLIPLEKVEGAADFLIEIMPVVFVPPAVGLIANMEALAEMAVPLFAICIVTTILVMGVTGRTAQWIMRNGRKRKASRMRECGGTGTGKEAAGGQETGILQRTGILQEAGIMQETDHRIK